MKQILLVLALTVAAISSFSCAGGKEGMCYSESSKEIKIFKTPWGDKTAKIESPIDEASGGRKGTSLSLGGGTMQGVDYSYNADGSLNKAKISIYVGEKREPKINIIYDYSKKAVESVTVDGKETPKCR